MRIGIVLGAALLAVLLAVGAVAAAFIPVARQTTPTAVSAQTVPAGNQPTITVTAEGMASAKPDQATISAGVQVVKPTAAEALAEASRQTEAVLAKLDELGIPREAVQTTNINLYPVYSNEGPQPMPADSQTGPSEPTITGYRAINQVSARITDLSKVGAVLDGTVAAGANQVSGVSFGLQNEGALRAQAMQQAVQAARPQADAIAAGLGLKTGQVLEIRDTPSPVTVMPAADAARQAGGASVPIEPGQLVARVQVQVTFALEPK